ncbi:MAG: hypothetical protein RIC56_12000 [Pseudomonadales bacterium]
MMPDCKRAAWLALGLLTFCGAAAADVVLETAVSKVESTLDGGGRVKRELVPAEDVVPGEELRYSITFRNDSPVAVGAERIVITNPIPEGTSYVTGSAGGVDTLLEYSTDGQNFGSVEPADGADGAGPAGVAVGPAGSPVRSVRWIYQQELRPGASSEVFFHVRIQ